jgi:hypothetical protein
MGKYANGKQFNNKNNFQQLSTINYELPTTIKIHKRPRMD